MCNNKMFKCCKQTIGLSKGFVCQVSKDSFTVTDVLSRKAADAAATSSHHHQLLLWINEFQWMCTLLIHKMLNGWNVVKDTAAAAFKWK